jgi:ketosteroid isomerase-like protein
MQHVCHDLKGRKVLSNRSQIESIIGQFYEAMNSDDTSNLPLAENAEYSGVLTPDPVRGEAQVRQHLQETAPFISNIRSTRMIIEEGAVASLTELDIVNGIHVEGTYVFDVENGKISRIRGIFDTRAFFTGSGG